MDSSHGPETLFIQAGTYANHIGTYLWQLLRANDLGVQSRNTSVNPVSCFHHGVQPRVQVIDFDVAYSEYATCSAASPMNHGPPTQQNKQPGQQSRDIIYEPANRNASNANTSLWSGETLKIHKEQPSSSVPCGVWDCASGLTSLSSGTTSSFWNNHSATQIYSSETGHAEFAGFPLGAQWFQTYGQENLIENARYFLEACDHATDIVILGDTVSGCSGIVSEYLPELRDTFGGGIAMTVMGCSYSQEYEKIKKLGFRLPSESRRYANEAWMCYSAYEHGAYYIPLQIPHPSLRNSLETSAACLSLGIESLCSFSRYGHNSVGSLLGPLQSRPSWYISGLSISVPFAWSLPQCTDLVRGTMDDGSASLGTASRNVYLAGSLNSLKVAASAPSQKTPSLAHQSGAEQMILRGTASSSHMSTRMMESLDSRSQQRASVTEQYIKDPEDLCELMQSIHPEYRGNRNLVEIPYDVTIPSSWYQPSILPWLNASNTSVSILSHSYVDVGGLHLFMQPRLESLKDTIASMGAGSNQYITRSQVEEAVESLLSIKEEL